MRQLSLLAALVLAACGTEPPPYVPPTPHLEANGLPASFTSCVQRQAQATAAIYDAYYPCDQELVWYVAQLSGMSQEDKATLVEDLQKRGLNYAQDTVTAVHGADVVRRTAEGPKPPPPIVADEDGWAKRWASCSFQSIMAANQQRLEADAIVGLTHSACGYLWRGSPEAEIRLYTKMLASVRKGVDPAPTVIEQKPTEGIIRM